MNVSVECGKYIRLKVLVRTIFRACGYILDDLCNILNELVCFSINYNSGALPMLYENRMGHQQQF